MCIDGAEFIRRARRYARQRDLKFYVESRCGKGSRQTLFVGDYFTVVPHVELKTGTYFAMSRDLNIVPTEF